MQAKYAYASGNGAGDDIKNRGNGRRPDVKGYRALTTHGSPVWDDWFEIWALEVDGTSYRPSAAGQRPARRIASGWQVVGFAPEYQFRDNLILEAAAGGMWMAGMPTACRAVSGTATGACGGPNNARGSRRHTAGSNFRGWEVDAGLRYSIMPGLTWTLCFGYADYGGATSANNQLRKYRELNLFQSDDLHLLKCKGVMMGTGMPWQGHRGAIKRVDGSPLSLRERVRVRAAGRDRVVRLPSPGRSPEERGQGAATSVTCELPHQRADRIGDRSPFAFRGSRR